MKEDVNLGYLNYFMWDQLRFLLNIYKVKKICKTQFSFFSKTVTIFDNSFFHVANCNRGHKIMKVFKILVYRSNLE